MTTIQAIRNIEDELAEGTERDCDILQFTLPDHHADIDKLADIHRQGVSRHTDTIAKTRKALRQTVAALNTEIDRLKAQISDAKDGAAKRIAAEEKIVAASKAFLKVVEG